MNVRRMTNDDGIPESGRRNNANEENFWADETLVFREEPPAARVYDLQDRTAKFGEAVIDFARTIPQNSVTNRIITQLVGAATSVGANYIEAATLYRGRNS